MPDSRGAVTHAASGRALLLWSCLLLSFSPILIDLARHLVAEPWARYVLIFPLLFVRAASRTPAPPPKATSGVVLIGLGVVLEFLAIGADVTRFGRIGFALAAIGLCRCLGYASWSTLLLLAFIVPLPSFVSNAASPTLEVALLEAAAFVPRLLGGAITVVASRAGGEASVGDQVLRVGPLDNGLVLVPLLVGLSWYGSLGSARPLLGATLRAAGAALLAIPVQILAIAVALGLTALAGAGIARSLLTHAPWMVVAALGLLHAERAIRRHGERVVAGAGVPRGEAESIGGSSDR